MKKGRKEGDLAAVFVIRRRWTRHSCTDAPFIYTKSDKRLPGGTSSHDGGPAVP